MRGNIGSLKRDLIMATYKTFGKNAQDVLAWRCKSGSRRESWIVRYLLPIPRQAELNEEYVRVRLGQKGCG